MIDLELDVTDRARAAGWSLPEGWTITATMSENGATPSEVSDRYRADTPEENYDYPTRGFCAHCEKWIVRLTQERVAQILAQAPYATVSVGEWAHENDTSCSGNTEHELDDPRLYSMWLESDWEFVDLTAVVKGSDGREYGRAKRGPMVAGRYPVRIDPDTGEVTLEHVDPLPTGEQVPGLIHAALRAAHKHLTVASEMLRQLKQPEVPNRIRIQQAMRPDLSLPYPFYIHADGSVAYQDFWKGRPVSLLGFQRLASVNEVEILTEDWWLNPERAVGMYPVFLHDTPDDDTSRIFAYTIPIEEVAVDNLPVAAEPTA